MLTVSKALEMPLSDGLKTRLSSLPGHWCLGLDQNNKIWVFCPPPAVLPDVQLKESMIERALKKQLAEMADDPFNDNPTKHYELEKRKVWIHGSRGLGKHCDRADKPIYTEPDKIPKPCRNEKCGGEEWYSKGIIIRIKDTKQIVHSER